MFSFSIPVFAQDATNTIMPPLPPEPAPMVRPAKELREENRKARLDQQDFRKETITNTRAENEKIRAENKALRKEDPASNKDAIRARKDEMKANRVEGREAIKAKRVETKELLQTNREEAKGELHERLEARKQEMKARQAERKDELEKKKSELIAKRQDKKEEVLEAKQKENVEKHLKRAFEEFDKAIANLNQVAERLESRIEKLAGNGVEVSEAKIKLEAAREAIDAATAKVREAALTSVEVTEGTAPKESLEKVRAVLAETKALIKSAREALVEATRVLKASEKTITTPEE